MSLSNHVVALGRTILTALRFGLGAMPGREVRHLDDAHDVSLDDGGELSGAEDLAATCATNVLRPTRRHAQCRSCVDDERQRLSRCVSAKIVRRRDRDPERCVLVRLANGARTDVRLPSRGCGQKVVSPLTALVRGLPW
jgi:hypothetical protein